MQSSVVEMKQMDGTWHGQAMAQGGRMPKQKDVRFHWTASSAR